MPNNLFDDLPEQESTDTGAESEEWTNANTETGLPAEWAGVPDLIPAGSLPDTVEVDMPLPSDIPLSHDDAQSETTAALGGLQPADGTEQRDTGTEIGFTGTDYCSWCQGTGFIHLPTGATAPCEHCGQGVGSGVAAHGENHDIAFTGYGKCLSWGCPCRGFEGNGNVCANCGHNYSYHY